jgi:predicted methyltransferase
VVFFFEVVYVVDYIDGFPYIEPSLHPWDRTQLIMVNDLFNVFLDSVFKNFNEYICNVFLDSVFKNFNEYIQYS